MTKKYIQNNYNTEICNINESKKCNNKQLYFFEKASEYAKKSTVLTHKHGCVIVKNGEIISYGYNKISKSTVAFTIHAELDALGKIKNKSDTYDLYVVRINSNGDFMLSKPCDNCIKNILKTGIRYIYFSR